MKIDRASAYKYLLYIISYCIVLLYCVYFRLELESDNLNYFSIFNDIRNDPFPFYFEMGVSFLMFIFNILGFDFYTYTFFKLLIFLPVFIKIDYLTFNNKPILSLFFLSSTLYPPFLDMMIFLSRQSLSINFLLFSILTYSERKRIIWFLLAFLSHLSAFIFIPLIFFREKTFSILINKFFQIFMFFFLIFGLFYKTVSTLILEILNNNIEIFPEFVKQNLIMKIGFYDWNANSDFDGFSYLRLFFIFLINLFMILLFNRNGEYSKIQKGLICIYLYSFLIFVLTIDNYMMAMRSGFFSYFFCLSWFFVMLSFSKKVSLT